jgi:hypothetical protein
MPVVESPMWIAATASYRSDTVGWSSARAADNAAIDVVSTNAVERAAAYRRTGMPAFANGDTNVGKKPPANHQERSGFG